MASSYLSWIDSNPQQANDQAQDHLSSYDFTQGATCQPLESASTHYFTQQPYHPTGAFVAPSPAMQFIPSPPPLAFDSSPDEQYSSMEGSGLDHDILNNLGYLDDFNFDLADYDDFELLPGAASLVQSPFASASFFPSLDSYEAPESLMAPPTQKFRCQFGDCSESFARQCELTRHEYKHTRPFKCPHCGRAFAEKRRCVQHVQSVHDLATDKDKTKCHLCKYAHVRPDAVKRHLRLKHGVGVKYQSSPSTISDGQSEGKAPRRKEIGERTTRR